MGVYTAFSEKWFAAWNSRDIDRIMELYINTVDFMSPKIRKIFNKPSGRITNKEELRNYFMLALTSNPNLHFELYHILEGVNSVVLYYRSINNLLSAEFMELNGMGKIVSVRAHYTFIPDQNEVFYITAMLFAKKGHEKEFREYENKLVPILKKYNVGIEFMIDLQQKKLMLEERNQPTEIHLLKFPSQQVFQSYLNDEQRCFLKETYKHTVEKSVLIKGHLI